LTANAIEIGIITRTLNAKCEAASRTLGQAGKGANDRLPSGKTRGSAAMLEPGARNRDEDRPDGESIYSISFHQSVDERLTGIGSNKM
jgi:hypothetical protein